MEGPGFLFSGTVFVPMGFKTNKSCGSTKVASPFVEEDVPENMRNDFESFLPSDDSADEEDLPEPAPPVVPEEREPEEQEPVPPAVLGEEEHEEEGQIGKAPLHVQHPMKKENLKVKFEADAGSSGSDLEIVCIKPASKKARRESARLKKEASSSQHSVRGPFCKQGHDMILAAPPADIIKNAREYDYFNVTCDLCGVLAAGNHTYRCDACDWDICVTCANKTK